MSSLNLKPQTLKDIESIDLAKHGFDREDLPKDGTLPADLPNSYKATNVHVFLSTSVRAPEWDSVLRNVPNAGDLEKHMKSLKEAKSESVFPKNGGAEPYRMTVFNLENDEAKIFGGEEQRVLIATTGSSSSSEEPAAEAKIVSLPVAALLNSGSSSSSSSSAPWHEAITNDTTSSTIKDHSNDRFVMICSHVKRDPRCGSCGAILVDLLQQEVDKQLAELKKDNQQQQQQEAVTTVGAFTGKIHIARCSHVGGHAHAGNVAVISKDGGLMFGCVNPKDVGVLAKSLLSAQPVTQSLVSCDSLKSKIRGALLAGVRAPKF